MITTFRQKNTSPHIHKIFYSLGSSDYVAFERTSSGTRINVPGRSVIIDWPLSSIHGFLSSATEGILFQSGDRPDNAIKLVASQLVDDDNTAVWETTTQILTYLAQVGRGSSKRSTRKNLQFDSYDGTGLVPNLREVVAIAPIRSRPKRTYDPIRESPNPEGDHIPMVLMRLSKTNKPYWEEFRKKLIEFGKSAELFSDIRIKDYSDEGSSPFQVQFKVRSGKFINVMDAGYGVSQCLPVVTSILRTGVNGEPRNALFLLQQPEVHLHPRAQAEIGNLVCNACTDFGARFLIETHSDLIVNRIRVMVRKGIVQKSDVSIIYFEKEQSGDSAKLFNIELDSDGNLVKAPHSYRDFFVAEVDKVLGFRD